MNTKFFLNQLCTAAVASAVTTGLFLVSGAYAGPRDLKVTGLSVVDEGGTPIARLGLEEVVFPDGTRQHAIGLFLHPSNSSSKMTFVYDGAGGPGGSRPDDSVYIQHPWARMAVYRSSIRNMVDLGMAEGPEQVLVQVPSYLMAPLPGDRLPAPGEAASTEP
jgi:hypothetical protein